MLSWSTADERVTVTAVEADLTEEFKEELVAVRQQCEGRTEVVKRKVDEVREEVTRLRRSLEKQSLGAWGWSECPKPAGQGCPYASSAVVAAGHSRCTCGTRLHPRMTLSFYHNLRHHRLSLDPPGISRCTATYQFAARKSAREDEAHQLSDCRSERRTRSLEDVRARSPTKACCEHCGRWGHHRATCLQLKDVIMVGGKRKQAGSSGYCPAKSSVGPVCVKCHSDATALAVQVTGAVDGHPYRQLCGVTGHCTMLQGPVMSTITVGGVEEKLPVFVVDMEEPCLLELDFLVQSEACMDLGRMQMQVRGQCVPLILEHAVKQVESPVTSSDGEDERLELHC
ncbi:hypothetical protein E2C01_059532 [Portunus trituberculatus]|uniref:Uncharacterized protein n=1 Tax=Portunus trituberculatus TaxID=210409 RepID=A0A5B7H8N3_PORTR|nr:hypothetical protein [Portunus trituberculatus]